MIKAIETGIRDCGMNLNPVIEENIIRVPLPKYGCMCVGMRLRCSCVALSVALARGLETESVSS